MAKPRGPRNKQKKADKTRGDNKAPEKPDGPVKASNLSKIDKLVVLNIKALLAENGGSADLESVCRYSPGGRADVERFGLFEIVEAQEDGGAVVRMRSEGQPQAEQQHRDGASPNDAEVSDDGEAGRKRTAKPRATNVPEDLPLGAPEDELVKWVKQKLASGGGHMLLGDVRLEFPGWSKKRLKKLAMFECHNGFMFFREVDRTLEVFDQAMQAGAGGDVDACAGGNGASGARFEDVPLMQETRMALAKVFKHERMTAIQEQTMMPILRGKDVLAKAKTGSGKTLAFLVPLMELLRNHAFHSFRTARKISNLIVVPTRELALQISDELGKLATHASTRPSMLNLSRQGGPKDSLRIATKNNWRFDFVVGTPGRMFSMLKMSEEWAEHFRSIGHLVLDEADQLLASDFHDELGPIVEALPARRQTLLFSATFHKNIMEAVRETLRPDHAVLDAIGEGGSELPEQIVHSYALTSIKRLTGDLWRVLHHQMEKAEDFKIIVFFQTRRIAQFFASLFRNSSLSRSILEMHGKLESNQRTEVMRKFQSAPRTILMSSDVSSRGMDYPDVTCILQVGIPQSRDIYLHRLGRTGRAGKAGENILLLLKLELPFLRRLRDIPITEAEIPAQVEAGDCPDPAVIPDKTLRRSTYASWIGYMCYQRVVEVSHEEIVRRANQYAKSVLGCPEPPSVLRAPLVKMGLPEDTPGLTLVDSLDGLDERPAFVIGVNALTLGTPDLAKARFQVCQATGANAALMGARGSTSFGDVDLDDPEHVRLNANLTALGVRRPAEEEEEAADAIAPPASKRQRTADPPPTEEASAAQQERELRAAAAERRRLEASDAIASAKRKRAADPPPPTEGQSAEAPAKRKRNRNRKRKSGPPAPEEAAGGERRGGGPKAKAKAVDG